MAFFGNPDYDHLLYAEVPSPTEYARQMKMHADEQRRAENRWFPEAAVSPRDSFNPLLLLLED